MTLILDQAQIKSMVKKQFAEGKMSNIFHTLLMINWLSREIT